MKKQKTLRQLLLNGIGRVWMHWPPRLEAKKRAKHPTKSGWYICELCKSEREKIDIDHVIPCIKPSEGWRGWDVYISSRFVEDSSLLQAICHDCHKEKSKKENLERRKKNAKLRQSLQSRS